MRTLGFYLAVSERVKYFRRLSRDCATHAIIAIIYATTAPRRCTANPSNMIEKKPPVFPAAHQAPEKTWFSRHLFSRRNGCLSSAFVRVLATTSTSWIAAALPTNADTESCVSVDPVSHGFLSKALDASYRN